MLIQLSDGCYVEAEQVAEIKVNENRTGMTVRTKNGIGHYHEPRAGMGVYEALDLLVKQINEAEKKS